MTQHQIQEAMEAVDRARNWVELAQSNPAGYTESQNHLNYAEQQLSNAIRELDSCSEDDRRKLQAASDLLRLLQETQQSLRLH
ncbi:hypothetical protein [Sediminibacillus massiliensis]|uniref:hypothetical protein n=1 Tax=Sediminibacillus massiliensis TaxID=1926277 RepID=UPI0009887C89|nr:hypothetical protein [Sediminibacillus massiliensis]